MEAYCVFFDTHHEAYAHMVELNKRMLHDDYYCVCVVDGPEDNFAVVDLDTAIDHGQSYEWRCK